MHGQCQSPTAPAHHRVRSLISRKSPPRIQRIDNLQNPPKSLRCLREIPLQAFGAGNNPPLRLPIHQPQLRLVRLKVPSRIPTIITNKLMQRPMKPVRSLLSNYCQHPARKFAIVFIGNSNRPGVHRCFELVVASANAAVLGSYTKDAIPFQQK